MSLETDAGMATVVQACKVMGISRAAYYAARGGKRPDLRLLQGGGQPPTEEPPDGSARLPHEPTGDSAGGSDAPASVPGVLRAVEPEDGGEAVHDAPSQTSAEHHDVAASPADRRPGAWQPAVSKAVLRATIATIVGLFPAWGVRKVWAYMRRPPYNTRAGAKRIWANMKDMGLTLPPDRRREPVTTGHIYTEEPNRRWATDLTTVWTELDGTVAITPVIDCGCRTALAIGVTKPQDSAAVLAPLRQALEEHFGSPLAVPDDLELRTDHGPQYTGGDCEDLCKEWNLLHTFAPVGRPTGNSVAERFIRTLKEECIWLRDWKSLAELRAAIDAWMVTYNEQRPHQALNWSTPAERRAERLPRIQMAA